MGKINVGLVIDDIDDYFSNEITHGALIAASELDINLTIIPGGYIGRELEEDLKYSYQNNALYNFASDKSFDFLIISIASIFYTDDEEKRKFIKSLGDIPIITLNEKYFDHPVVYFNNRSGIQEAISSLIENHNRKNIAMMCGPQNTYDGIERFAAYCESLAKYDLPFKKQMVKESLFSRKCEKEAAELLDANPNIDAIVCADDEIAIGVCNLLNKRGIAIGDEISVVGFDDIRLASKLSPALATVSADASLLGYYAIQEGIKYFKTKVTFEKRIDTTYIARESAGDVYYSIKWLDNELETSLKASYDIDKAVEVISKYIFGNDKKLLTQKTKLAFKSFLIGILSLKIDTDETVNKNIISNSIENFFRLENLDSFDLSKILLSLEVVFKKLTNDTTQTDKSLSFYKLYQDLIFHITARFNTLISQLQLINLESSHKVNMMSRDMLSMHNKVDGYQNIVKSLRLLNIKNAALCLYDEPIYCKRNSDFKLPDKIQIKSIYKEKKINDIPSHHVDTCDLINYLNKTYFDIPYMIMAHIYSGEISYGIFICDLSYEEFWKLEFITYQLGSAIKIIDLLEHNKKSRIQLENALTKMDRLSKTDELTSLFNRRGFINASEELLYNRILYKYGYVIFADLNGLKGINDNYGHEEGDFALLCAVQVLKKAFGLTSIIGRLGGDEFAVFGLTNDPDFLNISYRTIENEMHSINNTVGKEYPILFSYGGILVDTNDDILVSELIKKADQKMYESKSNK